MQTDFSLVFSAPRYCDSTENRGAYINIGPDYKLKYEQFDAVPHPDIKPMVRSSSIPFALAPSNQSAGLCAKLSHVVSDVNNSG